MIFIDQGEEGGRQDVFFFAGRGVLARGGFLQEGGFGRRFFFAGGGFWPEGDFGLRGVLSGGGFCPVPVMPIAMYAMR